MSGRGEVRYHDGAIHLRFPFDAAVVEKVRAAPGARWDGSSWVVPLIQLPWLSEVVEGWDIDPMVLEVLRRRGLELVTPGGPMEARRILFNDADNRFEILFPFDSKVVEALKRVPGTKWSKEWGRWLAPPSTLGGKALLALRDDHAFQMTASASAQVNLLMASEARLSAYSCAVDWDGPPTEGLGGTLMGFQEAGVAYMNEAQRVILADDMGLGKTVETLAALEGLDAFPAVVVCPSSVKYNWKKEAEKWLPGRTAMVLEGKRGLEDYPADIIILNYEILGIKKVKGQPGVKGHMRTKYTPTKTGHLGRLLELGLKAVVADEAHRLKSMKSLRTRGVLAMAKVVDVILLLTGTPVISRPSDLISLLQIVRRLEELGGWKRFTSQYCNAAETRFGLNYDGAGNLAHLNERLRSLCLVRRVKSQVLHDLPPMALPLVLEVPLTNRAEYDRAYQNVVRYVWDEALAGKEEPTQEEMVRALAAMTKARRAEHLVRVSTLKELMAEGKMEAVFEWVDDFMEGEGKMIIFAWHRKIVQRIAARYGAPTIAGGDTARSRQDVVDRFQTDPECRLVVANIRAGGESVTLTAATTVLFVELGWTAAEHDQAEARAHRKGQQKVVQPVYMTAVNSLEQEIWDLLAQKRAIAAGAVDGWELEKGEALFQSMMESMLRDAKGICA